MIHKSFSKLSKLKTELKTTNLKELKSQNERLRVELSRALLNEKDVIIEERFSSRNGYTFLFNNIKIFFFPFIKLYIINRNPDELAVDLQKKIIELTDENEFLIKENKKLTKEKERLVLNLNQSQRPNSRQSSTRSPIVTKNDSSSESDTDKKLVVIYLFKLYINFDF
jgi:hypothetical protein